MQQVPQIAPSLPEIRPAAPQRKGGDGFARLLDTMDAEPRDAQQPSRARDMDDAEPVKTRRRADHAGRPHQPRTERQDAKDTNKTDSDTDQAEAAPADDTQTADASATDSQPKEHKGKDAKDTADTAIDPQAATSVPADVKAAAVEAVAVPVAPAETNDAPVPPVDVAAAGIEAVEPQKLAPQLPAQAAAPETSPDSDAPEMDAKAQAAANAAKPAAKENSAPAPQAQDTPQTADAKAAAKNAAALPMPPVSDAAATPKADATAKAEQPVLPDPSAVQADAKANSDVRAKQPETLESALAKQFGGQFGNNVQITDNAAITLPDATRALQNHLTPASVTVQTSASAATNQPVPLQAAALAIEIAARAKDGMRQFEIRLDPPELGRVDVKLNVDKSGHVNTHLTVDRPETLDLLRRDAQGLERALQQAGLKTSDGNLEFSLRQQTPDGSNQRQAQSQQNNTNGLVSADADTASTIHAEYQWAARLRGGVDIRV